MAAECLGTDAVPEESPAARPERRSRVRRGGAAGGGRGQRGTRRTGHGRARRWSGPGRRVAVSIGVLVTRRLCACGPALTDVTVLAAVLGAEFDPALLPALAGAAGSDVQVALAEAQQAMLIKAAEGAAVCCGSGTA